MKKLLFIILSLALFTSCERKISQFNADKGSANFTTYVSVGNSLVAGYADGALYHDGQVNSCPNIIAGQLELAGGGTFVQPMVTSNYGVAIPWSTAQVRAWIRSRLPGCCWSFSDAFNGCYGSLCTCRLRSKQPWDSRGKILPSHCSRLSYHESLLYSLCHQHDRNGC